ncbi:MAG: hypothetical protein EOP84_29615, partial [Verrucomicrobiaceae bacterium]
MVKLVGPGGNVTLLKSPMIVYLLREGASRISTKGSFWIPAVLATCSFAVSPASIAAETGLAFVSEAAPFQAAGGEIYTFYAGRDYRPLWFNDQSELTPAAKLLISLLESSDIDAVSSDALNVPSLISAVDQALASKRSVERTRAELLLSRTFVAYVQALRGSSGGSMIYEHDRLRPKPVSAFYLLNDFARAASQQDYVAEMKWMHPLYAPIRRSFIAQGSLDLRTRKAVVANLARLRAIPGKQRHVLVDVASARLWMYEDDRVVDTMRVVVGKPSTPTPLMAGYIRYAIHNPYWNVPPEMVSKNIASNVLSRGTTYLKAAGYQILSDWSDNPSLLDPKSIDWIAASRGKLDLRVRQLPGAANSMGEVKFEFPNPQGIYLHDTPEQQYF